jgi:putative DNA primase/helicase
MYDQHHTRARRVNQATPDEGIEVVIERADTIEPENIEWLWKGWLACGEFHVLAGAKGTCKSTVVFDMAAVVTKGAYWPNGKECPQGDVLLWSGEDKAANTVMPRFLAAGGDPAHLYIVRSSIDVQGERPFDPATDLPALIAAMRKIPNLRFVVIDPVVLVVLGNSGKNAEVRRALQPLVALAEEMSIAILGITHFTKGSAAYDLSERVTESLASAAVPRVVMVAAMLKDGRRLFSRADSNIGPRDGGWEFEIEFAEVESKAGITVNTIRISWGDALEEQIRDLLAQADPIPIFTKRKTAKAFLEELLSDGPMPALQVYARGKEVGYSESAIDRAKENRGNVQTRRRSRERWCLGLAPTERRHGRRGYNPRTSPTLQGPEQGSRRDLGVVPSPKVGRCLVMDSEVTYLVVWMALRK